MSATTSIPDDGGGEQEIPYSTERESLACDDDDPGSPFLDMILSNPLIISPVSGRNPPIEHLRQSCGLWSRLSTVICSTLN